MTFLPQTRISWTTRVTWKLQEKIPAIVISSSIYWHSRVFSRSKMRAMLASCNSWMGQCSCRRSARNEVLEDGAGWEAAEGAEKAGWGWECGASMGMRCGMPRVSGSWGDQLPRPGLFDAPLCRAGVFFLFGTTTWNPSDSVPNSILSSFIFQLFNNQ